MSKIREALEMLQRSFMDNAEVTVLVAEAIHEVKAIEEAALDLREVAFDGPSEVKGAPCGESFWDWKNRIDKQTRWLSSVPGMETDK